MTPNVHLRVRLPDGSERSVPLDPAKTLRVGSNASVEIVVAAPGVQPLHCGIVPKGGRFQIAASKSAGKVQLNGAAVAAAILKPGDVIALGGASITVVAGAPAIGDELEVLDAGDLEVLETDGLEILDAGGLMGLDAGGLMGLDAGGLMGLDAGAGLGQPGLGGMSLGDPLSGSPLSGGLGGLGPTSLAAGMPQAAAPASVLAATAAQRPRRSRRWLKGIAATVAVLLIAALGVAVVLALPTADERFARAEQEYQAKNFAEADKWFDAFVASHPADPRAGVARIKRDLSRLAPLVDRGGDWSATLAVVQSTAEQWGPLAHLREAQAGLAEHLPRIAAALVERAGAAAERAEGEGAERDRAGKAIADARAALDLAVRLLPPTAQRGAGIDDLEVRLASLDRDLSRSVALAAGVERIAAAAGAGKLAEAFEARAALLDDYPVLIDNVSLREAQRQVAAAAQGQVRYAAESLPAERGEAERPTLSLALAARNPAAASGADGAAASGVVAVLAAEHGAVYGLEAGGGRVLWRRFVGFDGDHPPQPLDERASGFLVYDGFRGELVRIDGATGGAVWRQAIGPCDAPPVLHGGKAYVALSQGELVELIVETGEIVGRFTLPQPLSLPPTIDAESGLCYQLAEQGCLYVLSPERRTCDAVAYVGHERGLVDLPPALVAGRVVIVERSGIADTRLRIFKLAGGVQPTHTLDLPGRVGRPAVASDNILWLATDDGTLHAVENDPVNPDRAPQFAGRVAIRSPAAPAVVATHLALLDGKLWAAGDGLRRLVAPSQPAANVEPPPLVAGTIVQPPRPAAGGLLVVRVPADSAGTVVALVGPDGAPRWETRIAAPLAAAPVLDPAGEALWLCRTDGAVFRIATSQLPASGGGAADALFTLDGAGPVAGAAIVPWADGRTLVTHSGARAAWLHDDSGIARIELPAPVASPPALTSAGVLVAMEGGPVFLLPLAEGDARPSPFLPPIDLDAPPRWQGPAIADDGSSALVADRGTIYRLALQSQPAPRLTAAAQSPLASPLVSPPAVVGQTAWGATEAGELLAFQLSDLSVVATVPLASEVTFGPLRLGGGVVVATADRKLRFLGEAPSPQWEVELTDRVVGVDDAEGTLLVAVRSGRIEALDVGSGAPRGTIEPTGEPLAAGPLVVAGRLVAVALDGTLLVSRRPWREELTNLPPP